MVGLASKINSTITENDSLPKRKYVKPELPPRTKLRNHEAQKNFYPAWFKLMVVNKDISSM